MWPWIFAAVAIAIVARPKKTTIGASGWSRSSVPARASTKPKLTGRRIAPRRSFVTPYAVAPSGGGGGGGGGSFDDGGGDDGAEEAAPEDMPEDINADGAGSFEEEA